MRYRNPSLLGPRGFVEVTRTSDGRIGANVCDMNNYVRVKQEQEEQEQVPEDCLETSFEGGLHGEIVIEGSDDFPEGSTVHFDSEGNAVYVYPPDDDSMDVNHVADEIEVGGSHKGWMLPMCSTVGNDKMVRLEKATGVPRIVLRTAEDLKPRPQMFVTNGKPMMSRHEIGEQWADPSDSKDEIVTKMSQSPSMRPLFRMFGDAAIRKVGRPITMGTEERAGNTEEMMTILDVEGDDDDGHKEGVSGMRNQVHFWYKDHPLYWDRPVDYQEACEILCARLHVDEKLICKAVPQGFTDEGTFVIDLRDLPSRHDVHLDGVGSWGKPTGRARFYVKDKHGELVRCDDGKGRMEVGVDYQYKCMLKRYEHPATNDDTPGRLIKKIYTALLPPERKSAVGTAVVTYEWIGHAHELNLPGITKNKLRKPNSIAAPPPPDGSATWEAASFLSNDKSALPATICEYVGDQPLYAVGAVDFNTAASIILGGIIVDQSKQCTRVPQGFRGCGSFVVDTQAFPADAELRRDNNGGWGKPAGHSRYYKIANDTGDAVRVDKGNKLIPNTTYDIQILSKRYEHPQVNGRFVRKIYTGKGVTGNRYYPGCSHLAVIVYYWKGEPTDFVAGRQNQVNPDNQCRQFMNAYGELEDFMSPERDSSPHILEPAVPPPKRHRMSETASTSGMNDNELENLRNELYKKEYENQIRLSAFLDRVGSFMDRIERSTAPMFYQQEQEQEQPVWIADENQGREAQEDQIVIDDDGQYEQQFIDQ